MGHKGGGGEKGSLHPSASMPNLAHDPKTKISLAAYHQRERPPPPNPPHPNPHPAPPTKVKAETVTPSSAAVMSVPGKSKMETTLTQSHASHRGLRGEGVEVKREPGVGVKVEGQPSSTSPLKMVRHHGTLSSVPDNVTLKEPLVTLTDLKDSHGQVFNLYTSAQRRSSQEDLTSNARRSSSATSLRPPPEGMVGVGAGVGVPGGEGVRERDKSRERGGSGEKEKRRSHHPNKHGHASSRHRGASSSEGESTLTTSTSTSSSSSSSPAPIKLKLQLVQPKDEAGQASGSPLRLKIKRMPEQPPQPHPPPTQPPAPHHPPDTGLKMKLQLPGTSSHPGHQR